MEADCTYSGEGERGSMVVPYTTSFFWCFSLEMGAKIISFLHFSWSLVVVVTCGGMAAEARANVGTVEDADRLYSAWFTIALVVALLSLGHLLLAATLMYGAFKRKPMALRVWVWLMLALLAAALLFILASCISHGFRVSGSEIFLYFLLGVIVFGFIAYCILTVNSYYLLLKSSEDMEGPAKTNY